MDEREELARLIDPLAFEFHGAFDDVVRPRARAGADRILEAGYRRLPQPDTPWEAMVERMADAVEEYINADTPNGFIQRNEALQAARLAIRAAFQREPSDGDRTALDEAFIREIENRDATIATQAARIERLEAALRASEGYLLNARIDLETGAKKATAIATIDGGLKVVRAALAAAAAETLEQARLLGMGAERELALLSRAERAERERDAAVARAERAEAALASAVTDIRTRRLAAGCGCNPCAGHDERDEALLWAEEIVSALHVAALAAPAPAPGEGGAE